MILSTLIAKLRKPTTPRERWARRGLVAVVLYTVIGFFALPALIKWQMVKQLPKFTHREATVEAVQVNPYTLSLTISGLTLKETNGTPFAHVDEFYANFQLSSILRGMWTFEKVSLKGPNAHLIRTADGQLNFSNLLTNMPWSESKPAKKPLPRVLVENLVVTNALIHLTDHTRAAPFRKVIGPVWFSFENFTTHKEKGAPYELIATTSDGERFECMGDVSLNPIHSAGEIILRDIPIKKYGAYLANFTHAQITDGALMVAARYQFSAIPQQPLELVVTNADVKLTDLHAQAPGSGEVLLRWTTLAVTNASASLVAREARVPSVHVEAGALTVRREADGALN